MRKNSRITEACLTAIVASTSGQLVGQIANATLKLLQQRGRDLERLVIGPVRPRLPLGEQRRS